LHGGQHQLCAAVSVNFVAFVPGALARVRRVRLARIYRVGQRFIEVQLRREFVGLRPGRFRAHLEVDMDGSARIPARIDRDKADDALGVRDLVPSQELLPDGVEVVVLDVAE